VDFQNFTYRSECTDKDVQVRDGEFEEEVPDGQDHLLDVDLPLYGDLDGDGQEEAVIRAFCSPVRTSWVLIYGLRDGKPVLLDQDGPGYGAMGGIRDVKIENGLLRIETLWTDDGSTANPKAIDTTDHRLQDGKLVEVGETTRRPFPRDEDEDE
jgi:hypothetical protein